MYLVNVKNIKKGEKYHKLWKMNWNPLKKKHGIASITSRPMKIIGIDKMQTLEMKVH